MVSLPILINQVLADYRGTAPAPVQALIDKCRDLIETENNLLKIAQIEKEIQILEQKYGEKRQEEDDLVRLNSALLRKLDKTSKDPQQRRSSNPRKSSEAKPPKYSYIPSNTRKTRCF